MYDVCTFEQGEKWKSSSEIVLKHVFLKKCFFFGMY